MRTIRFIKPALIVFVTALLVATLGGLTSARSSAKQDNYRPVYPNAWKPGINQPCPKGSDKLFVAVLTVPKPYKIAEYGEMYLELKRDRFLVDEGYRVSKRKVEFHFFAPGRKARVLLNDLRDSLVYADIDPMSYHSFVLRKQCVERLPDME